MRLGLAANRLHHRNEDAGLFRWLRACEPGIRELNLGLHAVGRTYDATVIRRCAVIHTGAKAA
jgi:methylglyoxal synthase